MSSGMSTQIGPYEITREIGRGGMGVVYLARDTKLDRDVAIKVLPPDVAEDGDRLARFEREARLLAALNHPNILTIFDVGRSGETSYFVMELLQGRTLQERYSGAAVPWQKSVEIVAAIADGLAAAHARDMIHRDLKPDNIFLTDDGVVKILDFGLARRTEERPSTNATTLTQVGGIMGTPGYMAPEQVTGKAADGRSDIFAIGCVLHELLTGARCFERDTIAEALAALLHDEAPSLVGGGAAVPLELDRVIARCLEKDPQHRFQSARDLAFMLRAVLSGSGPQFATDVESTAHASCDDAPSIAVLPFTNMSADPENEFFSDGVSEEIINALAQLPELQVAGRTSSFSFKCKNEDLRAIADKLNVRTILEGSVRKAGGRVRVTAQLINASDGYQLWSERFDRDLEDIFEVQDEIARAIAEKLQVTLGRREETRLVESQTENPEAYQSYVKGRALLLHRGVDTWRALESFRSAVSMDPNYAQAWAGIAEGYSVLGYQGMLPPTEVSGTAKQAMEKALELGPKLAESHNAAAIVHHMWTWDWEVAEAHYLKSLELNPRYIQARCWYAFFYLQLLYGRHEEALEHVQRSIADDPLSSYATTILAFTLGIAGYGDEGIATAQKAIEYDPQSYLAEWALHCCNVFAGHYEDAIVQGESMLSRFGPSVWVLYIQGVALASFGRTEEAEVIHRELIERSKREYVQPTTLALIASSLGRMDEAFEHLERALQERDSYLPLSAIEWPNISLLQADPRWNDVRRRMGLNDI